MAAALIAFTQASLMSRGETFPRGSDEGNAAGACTAPGPAAVKPKAPVPATKVEAAEEVLRQLVVAVQELSGSERLLEKAQQVVLEGNDDAQKWHQVAITTMQWTQQAQRERVQTLLRTLKSSTLAQRGTPAQVGSPADIAPPPGLLTIGPPPGTWIIAPPPETSNFEMIAPLACSKEVTETAANGEIKAKIGSLRGDLERIRDKDPGCCLIVRHIKPLGLESGELLREHFGRLANVEEVHVAHSFEKPNSKRRQGRVRPAALGFVVMASKEGAERVLAVGSEQLVGNTLIDVRLIEPFDSRQ